MPARIVPFTSGNVGMNTAAWARLVRYAQTLEIQETMAISADDFIRRWFGIGGSEKANYQLFLTELVELLELSKPDPAGEDTRDNAYVFDAASRLVMVMDRSRMDSSICTDVALSCSKPRRSVRQAGRLTTRCSGRVARRNNTRVHCRLPKDGRPFWS